jgi:hypothetical protein
MNADGTNAHQIAPSLFQPDWSPNGSRIAAMGANSVYVMDSNGANLRQAVNPGFGTSLYYPSWSPDNIQVAVGWSNVNSIDIWAYDVDTGTGHRLYSSNPTDLFYFNNSAEMYPDWGPSLFCPAGMALQSTEGGAIAFSPVCQPLPTATPTATNTQTPSPTNTPTNTPTPTATPILDCAGNQAEIVPQYLYQAQGLTQEAQDMRAIASTSGLSLHQAPILNSPVLITVPWDTQITVEQRFVVGSSPYQQIWYKTTYVSQQGWLVAQIDDKTYIEGGDPCASRPTPTEFPFSYDRERVRNYAVAHAYDNDTQLPPSYRVTTRLSPPTLPFANFSYADLGSETESTGSAMFVSESIWIGGMPMTVGAATSCTATVYTNGGWRYCWNIAADNGNSSTPWEAHEALGEYYTTATLPPNTSSSNSILDPSGSQLMFPGPDDPDPDMRTTAVDRLTFDDVNDFIGPVDGGGVGWPIDDTGFSNFARTHMGSIPSMKWMGDPIMGW